MGNTSHSSCTLQDDVFVDRERSVKQRVAQFSFVMAGLRKLLKARYRWCCAACFCLLYVLSLGALSQVERVDHPLGSSLIRPKHGLYAKPWPASKIEFVDPRFCSDEEVCEECMEENPMLRFVRIVNGSLQLFGVRPDNPLVLRFPEEMTELPGFPRVRIPIKYMPESVLLPSKDCDRVIDAGPVFIDMPVHCSNAFHIHNDNIFKHLISAEMLDLADHLDRISLLQVQHSCDPSPLLRAWYSVFREVIEWPRIKRGYRLCIGQLQYALLAFEIFKNHKLRPERKVVTTNTTRRIVRRFREAVQFKLFSPLSQQTVDYSDVKGQLVLLLGRRSTNAQDNARGILSADQVRIQQAFMRRGLEFVIIDKGEEYRDLPYLWSQLNRAAIIIGPHGAGLANTLYARAGLLLVELRTEYSRDTRFFEAMAVFAGQDHVSFDFSAYQGGKRRMRSADIEQFTSSVLRMFKSRYLVKQYSNSNQAEFFVT